MLVGAIIIETPQNRNIEFPRVLQLIEVSGWMVEKYYELETTQPHFGCAS